MSDKALVKIENKLNYFLELQYGFSCLVEADKRDAGNNYWYRRADQTEWAATQFTPSLNLALASVASAKPLNEVRTHLREEALGNVGPALDAGKRILSLTAPTGSGKTLALLAIANSIRERRPDHAVIFAVPFLSITEQIEDICRNLVFAGNPSFVTRIDSRTEDPELEEILRGLDADPARFDEMLSRSFSIETFDAAFVVTTFVQFFETLLSNKGTTLLRLPNFAKCIFLIDEVQALPPRLYAFFAAYLDAFCKLVDSYAVLSTATMPAFGLSTNPGAGWDAAQLFPDYTPPIELVSVDRWYPNPVFNRYRVERLDATLATFTLADLSRHVVGQKTSSLIILNTIDDTRSLYDLLSDDSDTDAEIVLLNTRFVLNDRREKIDLCKKMLLSGSRVVLISTQLIEAGVDIDFPTVYRDLCPLPSLIQSAGRCNRNGENVAGGQVNFFELRDANGMSRAERVYRDQSDRWILDFSREQISGVLEERDLIEVQRSFFKLVESNLEVGAHRLSSQNRKSRDSLVKRISECAFEVVGSFRLIDKDEFGKDYQIYVPIDESDRGWDDLGDLTKAAARAGASAPSGRLSFAETKHHRLKIDSCIQRMSGRVVQVRTFREDALPPCERLNGQVKEIYGMRKLLLPEVHYSAETGIKLNGTGAAII
jgi:CRISPR-associated endonuclease/helicase Cas3